MIHAAHSMTRYTRISIDRNGREVFVTACVEDGSVTYAEDDDGNLCELNDREAQWAVLQSEDEYYGGLADNDDRRYDEWKDAQRERELE